MVAEEQRVEAGPPRRRGPLDHHARAVPRVPVAYALVSEMPTLTTVPLLHAAGVKRVPPSSRTM